MSTSVKAEPLAEASATGIRFDGDRLVVVLDDGREVSVDMAAIPWLAFLREAPPAERLHWTIEPGGFAVYWPEFDDGVEVCHLLSTARIL